MTQSDRVTPARTFGISVYIKCLLVIALTATPVAGVMLLQNIALTRQLAADSVRTLGSEVVGLIATNSVSSLRFGLPDALNATLVNALENGDEAALYGIAVGANGNLIAEAGETSPEFASDLLRLAQAAIATGQLETTGDGFMIAAPAVENGAAAGAIAMIWTPAHLKAAVSADKRWILVAGALTLLAMLIVGGALVWLLVSRPLRQVSAAMATVRSGVLDSAVPNIGRSDEIGDIANSLDTLRESLLAARAVNQDVIVKGGGFDGSSAAMLLADADLKVVAFNRAFRALTEERHAEMKRFAPRFEMDTLVGTGIDVFGRGLQSDLGSRPSSEFPFKTTIEVGDTSLSLTVGRIVGENETVAGYVIEWSDDTVALRNAALLAALEASQLQISFSADSTLVAMNARAEEALGSKTDLGAAKMMADLLVPENADFSEIEQFLRDGRAWFGKTRVKSGLDATIVLEAAICPITNASGGLNGSVLLGNDISEIEASAKRSEADRARMEADQSRVVESLRTGLEDLSEGRMTNRIETAFPEEYEQLRSDFNEAVARLDDAMVAVVQNAGSIRNEAGDITSAADDLSKRTEHQAATLEETAAALTEITRSVGSAAKGADEANRVVREARQNAEESGQVVREAVDAMGEIESSSIQISKIISVIDDIAFQTNLLALNAGVEAARAGEAGRGFAVVASEVRALAQRSSDAAREINELISRSGAQVNRGVSLVGDAGTALERIVASVGGIAEHVSGIAASAAEQTTALDEINTAMSQLDQVTQQNAAMFEETTAASHALTGEAETLFATMSRFETSAGSVQKRATSDIKTAGADSSPALATFHRSANDVPAASGSHSASAVAVSYDEDDWEDF